MALVVKDRVKQTTSTTGTSTLDLDGNSAGFQTFGTALSNADTTYYALTEGSTGAWEVGIGTFATGTPNTLARTTVLASSNSGSAINLTAGDADVFITQPAGKSAHFDASGNLTLNQDPSSSLQAATKQYVDTIAAAGLHYHAPVRVEHPSNLTATYDNGTSGVGATLTNSGTQAALVLDNVTMVVSDRVLIANQTNQAHNGVYTVTNIGSASTNWVLTRATDADSYGPSDPDALGEGDAFFIKEGDTNAGHLDVMTTSGEIVFGTTNIVFSEVAETTVYSAGDGLTLTGTTFAVGAGTGVTVNANDVAIGQAVGTGDNVTFNQVTASLVGNASTATAWQTSRTVSLTGDVTGSATGVDGSGNVSIATTIAANSVALGTDTTGNYVADITAGNLIDVSGGGSETATVSVAVDLSELTTSTTNSDGAFFAVVNASNVQSKLTKGNINISGFNNDAGYTTNVGDITGVTAGNYVTGGGTSGTVTVNVDATTTNTASKVVARDGSGNFSAGTITASLNGNADTASNSSQLGGQLPSYYLNTSTTFGGDVSGTYNAIVVANDSHTHAFNNLTGKTSGTGEYSTSGYLTAGRGSGGVSLTNNDGGGNANVTFNHKNQTPEQTGKAARIAVNTDSTATDAGAMTFHVDSGTSGVSATSAERMRITETGRLGINITSPSETLDVGGNIAVSGTVDGVDIAGSIDQAVLTTSSPTFSAPSVTDLYVADQIIHTGNTNTYLQFHNTNQFRVVCNGAEQIEVGNGFVLLNDNKTFRMGTGSDFRQYFDGTNMIFRNYNHALGDIYIQGEDTSGVNHTMAAFYSSNAAPYAGLWYDGTEVFTTVSGGVNVNGNVTAGDMYVAGSLYHEGDTNTRVQFGTDTVYVVAGGQTEITVNTTGVRLGDSGNGYFQPVTGTYGSIQIDGGAHGGWEGYSIGGRAVFMHNNNTTTGIYNDVDDEWLWASNHNGTSSMFYNGAERVRADSAGATIYGDVNSSSDIRYKKNIEPIDNALEKVQSLKGVTFDWDNDAFPETEHTKKPEFTERATGVIAQDVEKVLPEAVRENEDGFKNVAYGNMVGLLIEAIKEQQTQIDELKAEVAELKG